MTQATPSLAAPTAIRYWVLAWLCAAAMINYLHRNCISVAESSIRREIELTHDEMGSVMSAFFLTYAFGQLPAGWLSDRWGTRRALTVFALTWSVLTGLLSFASSFTELVWIRLAMGAAQAGIFACTTNTFARWFPPTRWAFASGVLTSFMSVGAVTSATLTGHLLGRWELDWRTVIFVYAPVGVVWAIGFFWWFRDEPVQHAQVNEGERELIAAGRTEAAGGHEPVPWQALLCSPALWMICLQQFFRASGAIFYMTWFPTFLKEARGVSTEASGWLTSIPLIAGVCAATIGGIVSDALLARTQSRYVARNLMACASMLVCAGFIATAAVTADGWIFAAAMGAAAFSASFSHPCSYSVTIDMGGKHVGTVFSLMNMAGNIGAIVIPKVIPWLRHETGSWDAVLWMFVLIHLAAAGCWPWFSPRGTIVERSWARTANEGKAKNAT